MTSIPMKADPTRKDIYDALRKIASELTEMRREIAAVKSIARR